MQAVVSPLALELAGEVKRAVASESFIDDTLKREQELKELVAFLEKEKQKAAQKAAQKATQKVTQEMERMLITAMQNGAAPALVEAMRQNSRITDSRLAELRKQANIA